MQIIINSLDLAKFVLDLSQSPQRMIKTNLKWVHKFTDYAQKKMKQYSKSKRRTGSSRGSGRLSNSIRQQVVSTYMSIKGVAYVPEEIKYQHAAEYGFKVKKENVIHAKGNYMRFHYSNWTKASRSAGIRKMADKSGFFHFQTVSRGVYKGMDFALKAFNSLFDYYNINIGKLSDEVAHAILLTTTVGKKQ
jgi:hypothetical protein